MLSEIGPSQTYQLLLVVQAIHLFHHRVAKRHISFAEVISGIVLCFLPSSALFSDWIYMSAHSILVIVQIIGSIWIKKLSPDWNTRSL